MNMQIYYFTGTGNSLAVARELNHIFNDIGTLIPIATFTDEKNIYIEADVIGFVFPVYFMNIPDMVKKFVQKLHFDRKPYIFAITTCNGTPGVSLFEMNKLLKKKGQGLSAGFSVNMPGNALVTPNEEVVKRLKNYKGQLVNISTFIRNHTSNNLKYHYSIIKHVESFLMKPLGKKFYLDPKKASCTSDCIGCGTCARVCPRDNIKMVNNKPQWGNECSTCLACFHWCPQKAIIGGSMLNNREQYHNPEVCLSDMK